MKKKINRSEYSGPDKNEGMTEYWGNNPEEEYLIGDMRRTGRNKSKSKGKAKGGRRGSMSDPLRDEFSDDSDLE